MCIRDSITGVPNVEEVVNRLPNEIDFQLRSTEALVSGSGTVRELLEMIQSVKDVCDEHFIIDIRVEGGIPKATDTSS